MIPRPLPALALLGLTVSLTPLLMASAKAPAAAAPLAAPAPDGRSLFLRDCATCHGPEGGGTTRGIRINDKGAADIDYEVSSGRMPLQDSPDRVRRHHSPYSKAEQDAIVAYASTLGTASGPDIPHPELAGADIQRGGELFRLQCAACHAWAGDGGALLQREAPDLHRSTSTQIAEAIRVGPGTMPVFGTAALTDDDVNAVVAYVRYLRAPADRGGNPLWHLGPLAEGGVAWVVGIGVLLLVLRWVGESEPR